MSVKTFLTPGTVTWLIPSNLDVHTPVTVQLRGAGGGGIAGAAGSLLRGTLDLSAFTAGVDTIIVKVGGKGGTAKGRTKGVGGTNGGGAGGNSSNGQSGSGGGGWTGILFGAVVKAVAAGGGGQSAFSGNGGGAGGTSTGANGGGGAAIRGAGGTPSAGGAGGASESPVTVNGTAGASLQGGHGCNVSGSGVYAGGGGGGGYFGGGGGGGSVNPGDPGGGGGGSDYTAGLASVLTHTRGGGSAARTNGYLAISYNAIPNGPLVDAGVDFDYNKDLPIRFTFSDPDSGDVFTKADVQWQVAGGGWALVSGLTLGSGSIIDLGENRYEYDFAGGTFAAYADQAIEIQVRNYDNDNAQGSWSASVLYTARNTPASATISAPTTTIDTHDPVLSWTTVAAVLRYQLAVFDSTGSTQLLTYAEVSPFGGLTSFNTDMPEQSGFVYVNGTHYQLGVRWQQHDGVWSNWALTGSIVTDINPPLTPTLAVVVDLATASVSGTITNPGGDPFPPDHNDVYRTDELSGEDVLVFTGIAVDGTFTDYSPGFNRAYSYRARAVTAVGGFADST